MIKAACLITITALMPTPGLDDMTVEVTTAHNSLIEAASPREIWRACTSAMVDKYFNALDAHAIEVWWDFDVKTITEE